MESNKIRFVFDSDLMSIIVKTQIFEFELRGQITLCEGNSGTGKTYFLSRMKQMLNYAAYPSTHDSDRQKLLSGLNDGRIIILNYQSRLDEIKRAFTPEITGYIIFIDDMDYIARKYPQIITWIEQNRQNKYVLMGRYPYSLPIRKPNRIKCQLTVTEDTEAIRYTLEGTE